MTSSRDATSDTGACAVPIEEQMEACLAHYEKVTLGREWNNQVPQAIRAWYAAKAQSSAAPYGWQPIDTAPKDRNIILTDGNVVGEGGWMTDVEQGADYEGQAGMAGWWCIASIPDG